MEDESTSKRAGSLMYNVRLFVLAVSRPSRTPSKANCVHLIPTP